MEIVHETEKFDYTLKVNYSSLLGDWSNALKKVLESHYMSDLMLTLNEKLKKETIYPVRNQFFKSLKMTQPNDLRVIFVDCDPELSHRSNGLAFGNNDNIGGDFSPPIVHLKQELEYFEYEGLLLDFDYSLEKWAKQGVLLLNRYLSVSYKYPHKEWEDFTKFVIKYLSNTYTGLLFVLISDKDNTFSELINSDKHSVLFSEKLDYNILKRVNNEIEYVNGKSERIKW